MSESKRDSFINFVENMPRDLIVKFDSKEDVNHLNKMIKEFEAKDSEVKDDE